MNPLDVWRRTRDGHSVKYDEAIIADKMLVIEIEQVKKSKCWSCLVQMYSINFFIIKSIVYNASKDISNLLAHFIQIFFLVEIFILKMYFHF